MVKLIKRFSGWAIEQVRSCVILVYDDSYYMSRAGPISRAGSVRRDDFQPGIKLARFAEMNFQPGFSTNDQSGNDLDHLFR